VPEGEQGERAGWDDEDVGAWIEGDGAGYVFGDVSWRGVKTGEEKNNGWWGRSRWAGSLVGRGHSVIIIRTSRIIIRDEAITEVRRRGSGLVYPRLLNRMLVKSRAALSK
jgi:hypothetical protein